MQKFTVIRLAYYIFDSQFRSIHLSSTIYTRAEREYGFHLIKGDFLRYAK